MRKTAQRRTTRRSGQRRPERGKAAFEEPMLRLRRSIDEIDFQLVSLLNKRAGHAIALGRVKKERGMTIYQPAREEEVLRNVQGRNEGPLENGAVRRLFERIIDESRRIERIVSATEGTSGGGSRDGAEALDESSD